MLSKDSTISNAGRPVQPGIGRQAHLAASAIFWCKPPAFRKHQSGRRRDAAGHGVGEPITTFLKLAPPPPTPSPPDEMISYVVSDLEKTNPDRCDAVIAVPLVSRRRSPVAFVGE